MERVGACAGTYDAFGPGHATEYTGAEAIHGFTVPRPRVQN